MCIKKKKRNKMCDINIYFVHTISFPHVQCVFFKRKMSKFRVRFDKMLLYEMCFSIGV